MGNTAFDLIASFYPLLEQIVFGSTLILSRRFFARRVTSPVWDARTSWRRILRCLIELLGGGKQAKSSLLTCGERIEATLAACWGPMLLARSLWREFGLESILDDLAPKNKQGAKDRETAFGRSSAGGHLTLSSGQPARAGAMPGARFCLWT